MKIRQPKISEIQYAKAGKKYVAWQVAWTDKTGKRQRKQFSERSSATMFASETFTRLLNAGASHRSLSTTLTAEELREAEGCFLRLAGQYHLSHAVDYFLRHNKLTAKILVSDAILKFKSAKEGVIRERSLSQFGNTLDRFETFTDNVLVSDVTRETIEAFFHTHRAMNGVDPIAKQTWNNLRTEMHLFFEWCKEKPQQFIAFNPAADVKRFKIDQGEIEILELTKCEELMRFVEGYRGGMLVKYFALALFAGVRPSKSGELGRLAKREKSAILLDTSVIKLSDKISKTRGGRTITIQPNLLEWLRKYQSREIFPKGWEDAVAKVREYLGLSRDVLRHTFISCHVTSFGSFAETAVEAGNSESIIRKHYYKKVTQADAQRFWNIIPTMESNIVPFAQAV